MAITQMTVNQISSEEDREKLLKVIKECSNSLTRMEAERDYIKEAVGDASKQFQLPKRLVKRMVKVYHKQNYDEEVAVHGQFEELYETVVK